MKSQPVMPHVSALVCTAMVSAAPLAVAAAEPFKITNIHFETNASACDMGIQMSFDTDGVSEGSVKDPNGQVVYRFGAGVGPEQTHNLTEAFQERVEPQVIDLRRALGCEREEDEPQVWLSDLLAAWPQGRYAFRAENADDTFSGFAVLSYKVPAGPKILAPGDGDIVPDDQPLLIRWRGVTDPILPELGPVQVVGYHVVIADASQPEPLAPGKIPAQLDVDVGAAARSLLVPPQFLQRNRIYEFEILATEAGGNQTISEGGVFCTPPIKSSDCEKD